MAGFAGMRWWVATLCACSAWPACASFHLYLINEIFSDASGNVQYVELADDYTVAMGGNFQNFLTGHQLIASRGVNSRMYSFPGDLPSTNTANTKFLVATQGFADLNIV